MPNPPPHTLSNLRPFKNGHDPRRNLKGRPAVGLTLEEAYSELDDREKYPTERLREISKEHKSGSWRVAAHLWLRLEANGDVYAKNGLPVALHDLDHLHNRTVGTPTHRVETVTHEFKDPADIKARLLATLAGSPQLREMLGVQLAGLLGGGAAEGTGAPNADEECG